VIALAALVALAFLPATSLATALAALFAGFSALTALLAALPWLLILPGTLLALVTRLVVCHDASSCCPFNVVTPRCWRRSDQQ
jgi:hypothetical protein